MTEGPPDDFAAPRTLRTVGAKAEAVLAQLLDHEEARWVAIDDALAPPLASLRSLLMGSGKRLRPAFCYWGFVGAGGDPDDPSIDSIGAAFEMLQAFALIHDDVMDGSDIRRGEPATHAEHAARHAQRHWIGESRRYGDGVAILVGDLAHVYADRLMRGADDRVIAMWDDLRIELNIGQYLDVHGTARADRDLALARRIAQYKSGKYTIERPLQVGAAFAGAPTETITALSAYGFPLGEAFQLRDDVLGAFGDPSQTGKPVGDDLIEGKPTPLLAIACERANPDQEAILARVGHPDIEAAEVPDIQRVLVETGAVAEIEDSITNLTAAAVASLHDLALAGDSAEVLEELARYVAHRLS